MDFYISVFAVEHFKKILRVQLLSNRQQKVDFLHYTSNKDWN